LPAAATQSLGNALGLSNPELNLCWQLYQSAAAGRKDIRPKLLRCISVLVLLDTSSSLKSPVLLHIQVI